MRAPSTPVLFEWDQLLRERGFQICLRPACGEPVWSRDGREYKQSDALKKARAERNEQLKKLEDAFSS